ncbi:unnamed protein product [Pieris macdunnoughi]|uniref:Peptidase S1 domain-containing protein n=1 Tax=Pieris macdunnoughi TaxID=345717 RepID=A0A821RMA1_9NEOP|nr:unnamed protein product [Pieris macdunnoughi]
MCIHNMNNLHTLVTVLFVGSTLATTSRIVGGKDTSIEQYPDIVQVEMHLGWGVWNQECGANILKTYWILSAAHCFDDWLYTPEDRRIRAGSTYRNTGGFIHYVEYEINHPGFHVASPFDADITVVKLKTPLNLSPSIQRGTIIKHGFVTPDNLPVVHAGWGDTSFNGLPSSILQHVQVYTVNNDLCNQRYRQLGGSSVTRNMICAGLLDVGGRDACQGDSGGPLYARGDRGNVIIGVVSWGHRCANATYPGISTNVASYTNWVLEKAR